MKGHIQIELKNEKSGKVDVYEQDNMVTSAVAKVLGLITNHCAIGDKASNYISSYLLPISTKALGGLFLFDGTLKEDVNNIHFPMDVHLVGSAGRTENASIKYMGSLNALESGETDKGYVSTWDFSTSQANGRIASLALTSAMAGEAPFYSVRSNYTSISLGGAGIAYNSEKGIVYIYSGGKIYARKIYTDIIRVNDNWSTGTKQEIFDFSFVNPGYQRWQISNGYDGYLYAIYVPSSSSGTEEPVRIRKIRISDYTFLEEEGQSIILNNMPLKGSTYDSDPRYLVFYNTCAISKGYLYVLSYDQKKVFRINLSNTVEQKEFTFDDYMIKRIAPKYNGGIYALFSKGDKKDTVGIVYPDGEYRHDEKNQNLDNPWQYASTEGDNLMSLISDIGHSFEYLGTICNLSSPVVKTSEQSMKITYTLTDV